MEWRNWKTAIYGLRKRSWKKEWTPCEKTEENLLMMTASKRTKEA